MTRGASRSWAWAIFVARSLTTCCRASNGLAGLARDQSWWKYSAAPWSMSQVPPCQTSRFGLRQVRSTFWISASNQSSSLAKSSSAVQPSGSKPAEPGR